MPQPPQPPMPGTVCIACVQMVPVIGETNVNRARSLQLIEQAAAQGAQLVVLPELTNSGYMFASRQEAFALAEPLPDGPTAQAWTAIAQRLGIYLVAGIAEHAGDKLYNSALVTGPQGYIGTYRKLHLWDEENQFFEPGNLGLPVFHTELGCLAVAICYDGWFPEVYRLLALQGADMVAVPTNWPSSPETPENPRIAHALAVAGAHSNGLIIACADRSGTERGQLFVGSSLIIDAKGRVLGNPASADREEIVIAQVDVQAARRARRVNAFNHVLHSRRADVYDIVSRSTPASPHSIEAIRSTT